MHHVLIMVVAADLAYADDGTVIVGPETRRVCQKAAQVYRRSISGKVIVTAGESSDYNVIMGAGPMRTALIQMYVSEDDIYSPPAETFDTNGEMRTLAKFLRDVILTTPNDTFDIFLVARWWHYPRARLLLRARLEPWLRKQTDIHPVRVGSYHMFSPRLWLSIAREFGAWVRNFPNMFGKYSLYTCTDCGGTDCFEMVEIPGPPGTQIYDDWCHRCKKRFQKTTAGFF